MQTRSTLTLLLIVSLQMHAGHSDAPAQEQGKGRSRPSRRLTAQEVARLATQSVVFVTAFDATAKPTSQGSAFFVDPHVLLTNFHVVRGAARLLVSPVIAGGHDMLATVHYADAIHDLTLLRVEDAIGAPLSMSASGHNIGDRVYVAGNPQGLGGTFSEGIISGFRSTDEINYIQITAPISPGSSGGPVFDERGEVIGVATASISGGQNLNLAVKVDKSSYEALRRLADERPRRRADPGYGAASPEPAPPKPPPVYVDERGSLRGVPEMHVLVEFSQKNPAQGLSETLIQTDTELKLRKAGIKVADKCPYLLYISLNMSRPPGLRFLAFGITVSFTQMAVPLDRDDNVFFGARTWQAAYVGTVGEYNATEVRFQVGDLVDQFINDFLAANAKR